ncbi:beta-lactamase [Oesophagostomum dentatum]|uniref:Beta-lactamase n=1 Tax=Oesophagostomum dentatum TaxID=61180 RepID=A0A0B1T6S8_OESDE|nr:beta-lactamase [Oesophagostomum dentatum]
MTASDVREYSKGLNGSEITSICSYIYMGTVFYVVNTDIATGDTVEFSLNLTMTDLERSTEDMLERRMKPSNISPKSGTLWVTNEGRVKKFQIDREHSGGKATHMGREDEIKAVFKDDVKHGREGYYPASLQVYRSENQTAALIIWEKGYGVRYRVQSGSNLTDMDEQMRDSRMKPAQISTLPGKTLRHLPKYYVVWHSDEFSWAERDIPRTALADPLAMNATELDLAVEQEMRSFDIPSVSLCIYRRGKRLLSVSYGYSDLRTETKAHPLNSYRIASISKTITAMGIAELVNRRLLSLDSRVFGPKGVLSFNVNSAHPWLRYVTVRHLLEHSSGGWGNMEKIEFNRTPQTKKLNGTALIDFYIKSYEPKFQPGTRYLYSNIAYVMLGQIIEQVSLRPYDQFIQDVILNPNKIEARIGDVEPGDFEVSYYSPDNANPYTYWTPSKLNAAAGWVMRAEEVGGIFYFSVKEFIITIFPGVPT